MQIISLTDDPVPESIPQPYGIVWADYGADDEPLWDVDELEAVAYQRWLATQGELLMTRSDILRLYDVVNGYIRSPGKFEAEPVYAPAFYDYMLDGDGERDDGSCRLAVLAADRREFPELGDARWVLVTEDDQGFVHCEPQEP